MMAEETMRQGILTGIGAQGEGEERCRERPGVRVKGFCCESKEGKKKDEKSTDEKRKASGLLQFHSC